MFLRSYHVEYEQFFHPALLGYRAECRGNISIARDISAILASIRRPRKYPGLYSASLQKYCASVEKIIRFFNYGMPYVDGNFHSGTAMVFPPPPPPLPLPSPLFSAREFLLRLDVCLPRRTLELMRIE